MRRHQLEHVLHAAFEITGDPNVLVVGSQAILGDIPEHLLPAEAVESREVDVAFFNDPGGHKANLVDGAIGEMSPFDNLHGYYAQGVDTSTATLPDGWWNRLVVLDTPNTRPAAATCSTRTTASSRNWSRAGSRREPPPVQQFHNA
jgi:hypothetical protein